MGWNFWNKKDASGAPKLSKPKDLPSPVGRVLVVHMGKDPDAVWSLKCVARDVEGKKDLQDIRIFDPNAAAVKGITVKDYNTLSEHSDMILFEGTFDKRTLVADIVEGPSVVHPKAV